MSTAPCARDGVPLDMLYFLGYNIDEPLPWHSTLSRTRQLYPEALFELLFDKVDLLPFTGQKAKQHLSGKSNNSNLKKGSLMRDEGIATAKTLR